MAEHDHGKMDITEQEKTFNGFISLSTKGAVICIVVLILLALLNA
ncbi:aa3-type cytochrome c oxidase subunit IV [Yoonia sp.]|nr:aa3-type cytochrome c oxidase subunit IV [Loktanella sp.]